MKAMLLLVICCLLFPTFSAAQRTVQDGVDSMKAQLQGGRIARVEILRDPDDVDYSVAVTQDALRSNSYYKIDFSEVREPAFLALLSQARPKASDNKSDLRWGILFWNSKGQEVGFLFVDHFGRKGFVNGAPVMFGSDLAQQLRTIIQHLR
jgi:hypothetical protein